MIARYLVRVGELFLHIGERQVLTEKNMIEDLSDRPCGRCRLPPILCRWHGPRIQEHLHRGAIEPFKLLIYPAHRIGHRLVHLMYTVLRYSSAMASYKRSDAQDRKVFEESVYMPHMERMSLPDEHEVVFEEEQPFDQIWLWVVMGIELLVVLLPLILTGQSFWTIAFVIMLMGMTFAFLASLNLRTRIDSEGVHYRMMVFHWKEQTIPWDDIDQIYVREYSPIKEYGGWGIKQGRGGRAYNVKGNYGIQITRKNGKRVLIGTQRPDEVSSYLSQHPLLV